MKYRVEYFPNRNKADFHINHRVIDKTIEWFDGKDDSLKKQPSFVREIFEIDGIEEVWLHQYRVGVGKALLFSWEDIEPRIMSILAKHFAIDGESVEVQSSMERPPINYDEQCDDDLEGEEEECCDDTYPDSIFISVIMHDLDENETSLDKDDASETNEDEETSRPEA